MLEFLEGQRDLAAFGVDVEDNRDNLLVHLSDLFRMGEPLPWQIGGRDDVGRPAEVAEVDEEHCGSRGCVPQTSHGALPTSRFRRSHGHRIFDPTRMRHVAR